jgi:hypothetical protein
VLPIILVACASAVAGIRPSFMPEESSWRATDIVVVTEGKDIDGVVQVIESWKGDLKPGSTLTIPELAEFKTKDARLIDNWSWNNNARPSEFVTGDRMILFLRDRNKIPALTSEDEDERNTTADSEEKASRWSGANPMGREVRYSTVWIERDKVFCFIQMMNPGPSMLSSTRMTEGGLRNLAADVISEQAALNNAAAITDPIRRAECLQPFIHSSIFLAREAAFLNLTRCGPAAMSVLREELNNQLNRNIQGDVVEALAKGGGRAAGPDLTAFLTKELEFWKQTAPNLEPGWWNGKGFGAEQMEAIKAVEPLRDRWNALLHTIYALRAIRYAESEEVVADLSDLWRSLPQMNGDQVGQACDDYRRALGSKRQATRRLRLPQYEIHFRGNKVFSSEELTRKMEESLAQYDQLDKDYQLDIGGGIFDYAVRQVCVFIWNQGYLDADFKTDRSTSTRGEIITLNVDEGKRYRIGEIRIEGGKRLSTDRIRAMLPLRTGDIADGEIIDKWVNELEESYHDLGYLQYSADIQHEARSNSKDGTLARDGLAIADFKLTISEGPQFVVEAVRFGGKCTVPEEQLRGAISLHSGDKFNQESLDASIKKLNQQFGLSLDHERDVELSMNDTISRVTIVIFLDQNHPPKDSFGRWSMKRKWYP